MSKTQIRNHRNRIALRWDSNCEAMLYSSTGRAISAFTGGGGADRRELAFLGPTLPRLEDLQRTDVNGESAEEEDDGSMSGDSIQSESDLLFQNNLAPLGPDQIRCVYYVEMACNGMFGNGDNGMIAPPDAHRMFSLQTVEVVVIDDEAQRLLWDLTVLRDLAKAKPPPDSVGIQAAAVGCAVINSTQASNPASVRRALDLVEASGIYTHNSTHADGWTQTRYVSNPSPHAQSMFSHASDSKEFKLDHTVCCVGHCHIDTAWLWTFAESRRKVARSWATQLDLSARHAAKMRREHSTVGTGDHDNHSWRFAASQAVQWEWLREDNPDLFERVRTAVKAGSFVPVGCAYTEFDANLPSGESMIRQFLYGCQFFQEEFMKDEEKEEELGENFKANVATHAAAGNNGGGGMGEVGVVEEDQYDGYGEVEEHTAGIANVNNNGISNSNIGTGTGGAGAKKNTTRISQTKKETVQRTAREEALRKEKESESRRPRYALHTESSQAKQRRNMILEKKKAQKWAQSRVFWLPDTFGYSGNLPQIMQGFDIPYFLSQKLSWNLTVQFHLSSFVWEGIDGSSVLAHFPPADTYNSEANVHEVLKSVTNHKNPQHSRRSLLLFGHGDGGGGPGQSHVEQLSRLKRAKGMPTLDTRSTPEQFFLQVEEDFCVDVSDRGREARRLRLQEAKAKRLQELGLPVLSVEVAVSPSKKTASNSTSTGLGTEATESLSLAPESAAPPLPPLAAPYSLPYPSTALQGGSAPQGHGSIGPRYEPPPRWVGELYLQLHSGTLTSQAKIKKQNRACENRLRTLEALLVYASCALDAFPCVLVASSSSEGTSMGTTGGGSNSNSSSPLKAISPTLTPSKPATGGAKGSPHKTQTSTEKGTAEEVPGTVSAEAQATALMLRSIREEIKKLWKTLLLTQFHDVIPGSSIGLVYEDTDRMLTDLLDHSHVLCQQLLEVILASVDRRAGPAFLVHGHLVSRAPLHVAFNGTSCERTDHSVQRMRVNPFSFSGCLPDVSAFTHKVPPLPPTSTAGSADIFNHGSCVGAQSKHGYVLENDFVRVRVSYRGLLLSLLDKRHSPHREVLSPLDPPAEGEEGVRGANDDYGPVDVRGMGNCITLHDDVPFFWDAWDLFPYHAHTGFSINHQRRQPVSPPTEIATQTLSPGSGSGSMSVSSKSSKTLSPKGKANAAKGGQSNKEKSSKAAKAGVSSTSSSSGSPKGTKKKPKKAGIRVAEGEASELSVSSDGKRVLVVVRLNIARPPNSTGADEVGDAAGTLESCGVLEQTIVLNSDSPLLTFNTRVEWRAKHKLLKVSFPLNVHTRMATYEIQSGLLERPTHNNTPNDNAIQEVAAQRFAYLSEPDFGVALLNDSKYGYSCRDLGDGMGSTLSLSLLRSPKSPDAECDMGQHEFTYALLPFSGSCLSVATVDTNAGGGGCSVLQAAASLNSPLMYREKTPVSGVVQEMPLVPISGPSLVSCHALNPEKACPLVVDAIKLAEDGTKDVIVRVVEMTGTRGVAVLALHPALAQKVGRALYVSMNEQEQDGDDGDVEKALKKTEDGTFELTFKPFKIITLRLKIGEKLEDEDTDDSD